MAKPAVVVYASKYGSTREVAEAIAAGLGADVVAATDTVELDAYTLVVLGSPLYSNDFLEGMQRFVKAHHEQLSTKRIAAFVLGATEMEVNNGLTGDVDEKRYSQEDWAKGLGRTAGGKLVASRGFGGRMRAAELDHTDRGMLEWVYRYIMHKPLTGFDLLDLEQARAWGESLRVHLG